MTTSIILKQLLIITSFIMALSLPGYGQDFGAVGTEWYYSEHAGGGCSNCEYVHYKSVKDTLISGKNAHKITRIYYEHTGDTTQFKSIYLYQEVDTVYMWDFSQTRFLKTYIFNAKVGDTLLLDSPEILPWADSTYRLVIDDVETVIIDGITLKKYRTIGLDEFQFWNGGYFMDRIGGLDWFFPRAVIFPEAGGPIRCYSDAQIDTNFQSVACDYVLFTSVEEHNSTFDLEVYPNPTSDIVFIKSDQQIESIEVRDLSGQKTMVGRNSTIDLSLLPDGIYMIRINFENGYTFDNKVIKSHCIR